MEPLKVLDLFAGCGGMSLGFEMTGCFESVLAVEWDPDAASTYAENFDSDVFVGAIEDVETFPEVDVVIGGPPCQGFSPLNMARTGLDRRNLWREYLRALDDASPAVFVMENVPELLTSEEFQSFRREVEKRGYVVEGRVLNAADFGTPQVRRRAIVIGTQSGKPVFPSPTHARPGEGAALPAWKTFRDAVRGLPLRPTGVGWHNPRKPTAMSVERYETIPGEGEGRFQLAERRPDITPTCWLNKPTGSTDVFGRLWWDRPSVTIRTEFFKPEKGRYLHPSEHRPITIREGARCMGFPDSFLFPMEQSMTSVGKQIGNAVPPPLAREIALVVSAMCSNQPNESPVAA